MLQIVEVSPWFRQKIYFCLLQIFQNASYHCYYFLLGLLVSLNVALLLAVFPVIVLG